MQDTEGSDLIAHMLSFWQGQPQQIPADIDMRG